MNKPIKVTVQTPKITMQAKAGLEIIQYGTLTIGETITLAAGENATVSNSGTDENAVLKFGIPKGHDGTNGKDGTNGVDGTDGKAATIAIGTVTTGEPGSNASVINVGTDTEAVLAVTIPRGDKGIDGTGTGDVVSTANNTFTATNTFDGVLKTTSDMQHYSTQTGGTLVLDYNSDNIQSLTVTSSSAEIRYSDTTSNMTGYKKTFIVDVYRNGTGPFSLAPLNVVNGQTAALYIMDGTLPDIAVGELLKLGLEIDTERNAIFVHTLGKVAL